MNDIKPFDFGAAMAAQATNTNNAETANEVPPQGDNLCEVRFFTPDGIVQAESLLKRMRTDNQLYADEVSDLVEDPQYARLLDPVVKIDRSKKFSSKQELCEYFTSLFSDAFLSANRKNTGLWTWLAFAFFPLFVKKVKGAVKIAANPRWVFDFENYRLAVRHYVAGPLYLWQDFHGADDAVQDMLFSSPPAEFGGFIDAITYKMEGTRIPATMQVAAWLYYDAHNSKRLKKGSTAQDKPGTIRELLRVVSQFTQTRDFYGVNDASEMWHILPSQFAAFKGEAQH